MLGDGEVRAAGADDLDVRASILVATVELVGGRLSPCMMASGCVATARGKVRIVTAVAPFYIRSLRQFTENKLGRQLSPNSERIPN